MRLLPRYQPNVSHLWPSSGWWIDKNT